MEHRDKHREQCEPSLMNAHLYLAYSFGCVEL